MPESLIVSGIVLTSFCLHVGLYRVLKQIHSDPLVSVGAYGAGLAVLIILIVFRLVSFPFTAITFFILASVILSYISFAQTLGGETPTDMILTSFSKHPKQNIRQLESHFTTTGLIWKRVGDLVTAGIVIQKNDRLIVTPKGLWIATCIRIYQTVFRRTDIG